MTLRTGVLALCGLLAGSIGIGVCGAAAQRPPAAVPSGPRPLQVPLQPRSAASYGTLAAGEEAHQRAERQNRMAIDRQLGLIAEMRWHGGLPGVSTYYGYPPTLAAIYAYGGRRAVRASRKYWRRHPYYYAYPPVFAPWPLVPGDIYRYPYAAPVEQPSAQRALRASPNGAVYRPLHEWELIPRQSLTPFRPGADASRLPARQPPVEVLPHLPGRPPQRPAPSAEIIPAPQAEEGPREF